MKILDVCCGSKMFWYDKHEPHTTYMDIRKAVYTAPESKPTTKDTMSMMCDSDDNPKIVIYDDWFE